jgi:hypothetical protein
MKPRHVIPGTLLALVLAYPLSYGPVFRWYSLHPEARYSAAVVNFYAPLVAFRDNVPFAETAMMRYLKLWVPVSKPEKK